MHLSLTILAKTVKAHREHLKLTQAQLAERCGDATNRSAIAHFEQGIRIPKADVLADICRVLQIPNSLWEPFTNSDAQ
jgi:transcriptional regulator with XRE-family HTH domain